MCIQNLYCILQLCLLSFSCNFLFNYEFFNVFAKIEEIKDDIKLKGKILGKEYTWKIAKEEITNTDVDLEVLFAKQEIERLEDYIKNTFDYEKIENYKKMIIDIAVKYNINSALPLPALANCFIKYEFTFESIPNGNILLFFPCSFTKSIICFSFPT